MQRFWKFIYSVGAVLGIFGGYSSLAPERTANTNADWVLVAITFVVMCIFPLGVIAYSSHRGVETFRRPSADRQPLGWRCDTLQPLRVSLAFMALFWVGSCFALPKTDHRGVMLFWVYSAWAIGLFIGERLVYRIHAKKIV